MTSTLYLRYTRLESLGLLLMASLPLFSCRSLCPPVLLLVHYACLCSGGHIYLALDYFPHWAVALITSARPRFVSRHLINENESGRAEAASVFMPPDDLICGHPGLFFFFFSPLPRTLDSDRPSTSPSLCPGIFICTHIYIAISSFWVLCSLFIDAPTHAVAVPTVS